MTYRQTDRERKYHCCVVLVIIIIIMLKKSRPVIMIFWFSVSCSSSMYDLFEYCSCGTVAVERLC